MPHNTNPSAGLMNGILNVTKVLCQGFARCRVRLKMSAKGDHNLFNGFRAPSRGTPLKPPKAVHVWLRMDLALLNIKKRRITSTSACGSEASAVPFGTTLALALALALGGSEGSAVPFGTKGRIPAPGPNVETLGYCQKSLRDN